MTSQVQVTPGNALKQVLHTRSPNPGPHPGDPDPTGPVVFKAPWQF